MYKVKRKLRENMLISSVQKKGFVTYAVSLANFSGSSFVGWSFDKITFIVLKIATKANNTQGSNFIFLIFIPIPKINSFRIYAQMKIRNFIST